MADGAPPAGKTVCAEKPPPATPSSTATPLAPATARSGSPSPSKSPLATSAGALVASYGAGAEKAVPAPPSSTETSSGVGLTTARSGSPLASKSLISIALGPSPAGNSACEKLTWANAVAGASQSAVASETTCLLREVMGHGSHGG